MIVVDFFTGTQRHRAAVRAQLRRDLAAVRRLQGSPTGVVEVIETWQRGQWED